MKVFFNNKGYTIKKNETKGYITIHYNNKYASQTAYKYNGFYYFDNPYVLPKYIIKKCHKILDNINE